jgi:hypothetical protein
MTARSKKKDTAVPEPPASKGWIKPKAAIRMIALVSILLAVWTTYQVSQFRGLLESIMWGLIFAATIWLVAGLAYLVTKGSRRS